MTPAEPRGRLSAMTAKGAWAVVGGVVGERLQWVDHCRSISIPRTVGIGASFPFPLAPPVVG
jgi:hypothetical protein